MPANPSPACFLDTNIWLYAFIATDNPTKSSIAGQLVKESEPVVSVQVINEVCINLLKKAKFGEGELQQLIESFYEKYRVIDFSQELLLHASHLRQRYSLSFWDSMIVASAIQSGVAVLYSEDMQHNLIIDSQIQIINPFAT